MDPHVNAVERAFQLAKTGRYSTVEEIKRDLKKEGYLSHYIEGRTLSRQLRDIIRASDRAAAMR